MCSTAGFIPWPMHRGVWLCLLQVEAKGNVQEGRGGIFGDITRYSGLCWSHLPNSLLWGDNPLVPNACCVKKGNSSVTKERGKDEMEWCSPKRCCNIELVSHKAILSGQISPCLLFTLNPWLICPEDCWLRSFSLDWWLSEIWASNPAKPYWYVFAAILLRCPDQRCCAVRRKKIKNCTPPESDPLALFIPIRD